jgi:hypothetical protein
VKKRQIRKRFLKTCELKHTHFNTIINPIITQFFLIILPDEDDVDGEDGEEDGEEEEDEDDDA